MHKLDVVILTWNDGELLDNAIRSVQGSVGVDALLVVVDNGSYVPARVPAGVDLVRNAVNAGVARGRNKGVERGFRPYVCLLDSDAELHPDTLRQLVEVVSQPGIGLAAPVYTGQPPQASAGRAPGVWWKALRAAGRTEVYRTSPAQQTDQPVWDVEFAIGACQVFRREAWAQVGGIDERYFYGPEDVDFCLRLRQAGWRVVQVQNASCDHPPRRRNRRLATVRGIRHGLAVCRYLARRPALLRAARNVAHQSSSTER